MFLLFGLLVFSQFYLPLRPLITPGFLPNREAYVTTTASAVLYDVGTGYVYGLAEATQKISHIASMGSTTQAIDNVGLETEKGACAKLIEDFAVVWNGILKEYKK